MRLKFTKGSTPEAIARAFVDFIREENLVIGAVNMYVQVYDEDMKPINDFRDRKYMEFSPTETGADSYREDVANVRRQRMKLVQDEPAEKVV